MLAPNDDFYHLPTWCRSSQAKKTAQSKDSNVLKLSRHGQQLQQWDGGEVSDEDSSSRKISTDLHTDENLRDVIHTYTVACALYYDEVRVWSC
mgnify:CR=1 FL=1